MLRYIMIFITNSNSITLLYNMKLLIGGYLNSTANIYGKNLYTQERVVLSTVTKLKVH